MSSTEKEQLLAFIKNSGAPGAEYAERSVEQLFARLTEYEESISHLLNTTPDAVRQRHKGGDEDLLGLLCINYIALRDKPAVTIPEGLSHMTARLVVEFASAMAAKLRAAEVKYGFDSGWSDSDWVEDGECLKQFNEHVEKGDPRDVANYCAFLWYHQASTVEKDSTKRAKP